MKKSSLAVFAFALLAAAAPFAALLVPPAAPTPPTDSVQADDLSPAATPQPLPTMPPSNAQNGTTVPNAALAAADITLYDADTGTNRVVSVRDFLIGAAACEMPPTWNDDTLLAQMVASHSYALALGAPMQVNSALCAGWTDTEVLKARWGDDFTAYYSRFAALADGAAGALLCYGGAPAAACYHSISNGVTEASQNVWTSALPYLQGVASPWDKTADGYETTITYSCEQVDAILQGLGLEPETLADTAPAAWFGAAPVGRSRICSFDVRLRRSFFRHAAAAGTGPAFDLFCRAVRRRHVHLYHPRLRPLRGPEPTRRPIHGRRRRRLAGKF